MFDKKILLSIVGAIGASLCCITPVLAVLAGSTAMASSFSWIEPFRPYLIALTLVVLAYAWWDKLKVKESTIECACDEEGKVSFVYSKVFLGLVTLFVLVMFSFPYWGNKLISSSEVKHMVIQEKYLKKIEIDVEGMTCKACEVTVEKIGGHVGGVGDIKASVNEKKVFVTYDTSKTDAKTITQAIATTGYIPTSYKDANKTYKITQTLGESHSENVEKSAKCGGGKCGASKCGSGKCGSSK